MRCEVNVELARDAKTLVDLEALVDIGIVDETLPADCGAWLLEVGAHDDAEVVLELLCERFETLAVLDRGLGVMDGARSDHDQQTVILLCDDLGSFFAATENGLLCVLGNWELVGKELGRNQWVIPKD